MRLGMQYPNKLKMHSLLEMQAVSKEKILKDASSVKTDFHFSY